MAVNPGKRNRGELASFCFIIAPPGFITVPPIYRRCCAIRLISRNAKSISADLTTGENSQRPDFLILMRCALFPNARNTESAVGCASAHRLLRLRVVC
jgi:hypothetical protein